MNKMIVLSVAWILLLSACATNGELDAASDGATEVPESTVDGSGSSATAPSTTGFDPSEGSGDDFSTDDSTTAPQETTVTSRPADDGATLPKGGGSSQAQFAIDDLASYLGVSTDAVVFVSMEDIDWPDGSLGCPQPGMAYTQAIVNGYMIILQVDGASHEYHGRAGADPFLCERSVGNGANS